MTVKSAAVPACDCLTCSRSSVYWVAKATRKRGRASLNHPGGGSAANNPGQYLFAAVLCALRAVVLVCVTVTSLVATSKEGATQSTAHHCDHSCASAPRNERCGSCGFNLSSWEVNITLS